MRFVLASALLCLLCVCGVDTAFGSSVDALPLSQLSATSSRSSASSYHVESTAAPSPALFTCLNAGSWADYRSGISFNRGSGTGVISSRCTLTLYQGLKVTVTLDNLMVGSSTSSATMPWYSSETVQVPTSTTPSARSATASYSSFAGTNAGSLIYELADGVTESKFIYVSFPTPTSVTRWQVTLTTEWSSKTSYEWKYNPTAPCALQCKSGSVEVESTACSAYSGNVAGCGNGGSCPSGTITFDSYSTSTAKCSCLSGWTGTDCRTVAAVTGTWKIDTSKAICAAPCNSQGNYGLYSYVCTSSSGDTLSDSRCTSPKPSASKLGPSCTGSCSKKPTSKQPLFTSAKSMNGNIREINTEFKAEISKYRLQNGVDVDVPRGTLLADVIGTHIMKGVASGVVLSIGTQWFNDKFPSKVAHVGRSAAAEPMDVPLVDQMQQLLSAGLTDQQILSLPEQMYLPAMARVLITDANVCTSIANNWTPADTLSLADLKGMLPPEKLLIGWKTCTSVADRSECGILMAQNTGNTVYRSLLGEAIGSNPPCISQTLGDPTVPLTTCISQTMQFTSAACSGVSAVPTCAATKGWSTCANGVHTSSYNQHGCADVAISSLCAFRTAASESSFLASLKAAMTQFGQGAMCVVDLPMVNGEMCLVSQMVPNLMGDIKSNITAAIATARSLSANSAGGGSSDTLSSFVSNSAVDTTSSTLIVMMASFVSLFLMAFYNARLIW